MKKRLLLFIGISVIAAGIIYAAFFTGRGHFQVLVFSKTEGFRHSSIEIGQQAIRDLGKKHGFSVDVTEDATFFTEDSLHKYSVVVFLNTTGDILSETQQIEFNRYIQAGGGYVGVHAAADTEYDWAWYGKLVGGYFKSHPNNPNVRDAEMRVIDATHPSTSHLPKSWKRTDEWYNYRAFEEDLEVLLNLDENSYEGGENGENHPIAWYHDFDGGRAFYTGLGHTEESYQEPMFLEHLWGGISYAAGDANPLNYDNATVTPEENRFAKVVLDQGLNEPMELELLPDGSILFVERRGAIKLRHPDWKETKLVKQFPVHSGHEDGLLGLTLDPNYTENNWIYLFYSPVGDEPKQHVSRFVFKDEALDMDSEKVLLEIGTQRDECCHAAGSLEFGPNGNLFISTGDNTSPRATGFAPIDEREGRSAWDAQKSSGNTNDLRGKILRIHPEADGAYSIPEGNLFPEDGSMGRPEIYVMGCRNPFRISIDDRTGYLYWGDVGPDAGSDSTQRGPMGYDEVNQARQAGFFGWPYFIGDNYAYHEYDFASKTSNKEPFDPLKPINNSPNNTGAKELPPAHPAFIWYPYGSSKEFPLTGDGGRNAMAGPVYYIDDYTNEETRFPEYYDGKLFTYDWMRGWVMAVSMDNEGNFKRMERFLPNFTFNNLVDMLFGPNGDIYLLEYGTRWFSENEDARLVHLTYTSGNRVPLAKISADKAIGSVPMTVNFSADQSIDFDGDELEYAWSFEGEQKRNGEINMSHTFDKAGTYRVSLEVKDPSGEIAHTELEVLVGNDLPKVTWELSGNQSFYWENDVRNYKVLVSDTEDGNLGEKIPEDAVTVTIDYLERGSDKTLVAQGHNAMMDASQAILGKSLMEQSDCKGCHQTNATSVGPSYQAISEKYQNDPRALSYLSEKIMKGGGGVWGDLVMAAHPQLSQSEAEQMVKYILSLSGKNLVKKMPSQGDFTLDQHIGKGTEGSYIFTASYTDKGGKKIGPLTGRDVKVLRNPQINATTFDGSEKAMVFDITPDMVPDLEETLSIVLANKDGYIHFNALDLTGVKSITAMAVANSAFMSGGTMELRLDNPEGEFIGELEIESSLSMSLEPDPLFGKIKETVGIHDLYLVFKGKNDKPVCAILYFTLGNTDKQPEM